MTARNIDLTLPFGYLQHWAKHSPSAPAVRDGVNELSYAEVFDHARRLSTHLRLIGVRPGEVIALEMSVALQVVFMMAAAQLRLVSCSHRESTGRNEGFQADWLFSSSRTSSDVAARVVTIDGAFLRDVQETQPLSEALPYDSLDATYRIAFSSGTTGAPKAVPLTLEMVHHRALAARELVQNDGPFMSLLDLGTASGFHTFHDGLMRGACYYNPGDATHTLSQIRRFGITAIKTSPVQLSELCAAAARAGARLDSLRSVYSAGSILPIAVRHAVREVSDARVFTLYGSTEAGRCAERELLDDDLSNVGEIVDGTELSIVDSDGVEVSVGEIGHIRYQRAQQASHYLADPEASAAAFHDGWFITGDLGHLNQRGELILDGRARDVVNAGGVKVNLHEVETFAMTSGQLTDAAAVVFADDTGIDRIALAVVRGPATDLAALGPALNVRFGSLAPHIVVGVPNIPRNAAGKIDRSALTTQLAPALRTSE